MSSGKKIAASLLAATLLLAVCTAAGYAGFFTVIETRFYRSARIKFIQQQLERVSTDFDSAVTENSVRFKQFSVSQGLSNSFDAIQLDADIESRIDSATTLLAEIPGLRGIRLVANDDRRIHYSTFAGDLFQNDTDQIAYTNYSNLNELPYEEVAAAPNADYRLVFDAARDNLVFALPVFDRSASHKGTLLFYVNAGDFSGQLAIKDSIDITDRPALSGNGIVFGLPAAGRDLLIGEINKHLSDSRIDGKALLEIAGTVWVLFSTSAGNSGSINWIYPEEFFTFPPLMRLILLGCVFVSAFLVLFLCLNIKHDDEAIIRDRIRKFLLAFFHEYLEKREEINWHTVSSDIMHRKDDLSNAIKKSLGKRGKKHKELVDALLEKSWDEIFTVTAAKPVETEVPEENNEDAEELETLEEFESLKNTEKIDDPEELTALEEFGEIGSLEEFEMPVNEEAAEDNLDGLIELTSAELDTSFFFNTGLFFPNVEPIELYNAQPDIIVEHDGLYTIPKLAPLADMEQDSDFKTLVESVMR